MAQKYAINMDDGYVMACTTETLGYYKYREISEEVAMAIAHGLISAQEVIRQIELKTPQQGLSEMLRRAKKANVRDMSIQVIPTGYSDEDIAESYENDPSPVEVKIPAAEKPAKAKKETPAKETPAKEPQNPAPFNLNI